MFCAQCGSQLESGAKFCTNCGARVLPVPAAPEARQTNGQPVPPQPAQPQPAQPQQPQPQQPQPQQPARPQQPQWQQPAQPQQPQWQQPARPQQPQWQQPAQPQQPQWQQPAQPQPPQWQQPAQPQPPQQPPQQPQWHPPVPPPQPARPAKKGRGGLIAGAAAVVLALVIGVGGFVWPGFFRKGPGITPEKPGTQETERPAATNSPKATDAPGATDAPRVTLAPRPAETPAPTPEPTPAATPYQNPFGDVAASDWYYDAVMWAGERGIVSGTEFKPKGEATRAQAITFLWRAAGEPEPSLKVSPYTDVKEGDYFLDPVLWGFENGLVSTAKDAQFHPTDTLTRATALTFISRAVDGKATGTQRSFADVPEGKWYFDVANWALENGVVGRDDSWSFYPDETVTRAQFITFLHRAMDPAAEKADPTPPGKQSFEALGISSDCDNFGPKTFNTITSDGEKVTFTAEVTDYRVFETDDAYPRNEGYEWRVMTVHISVKNDPERSRTYLIAANEYDLYNVALFDDSDTVVDNVDVHTIIYNGVPTECTVWKRYDYENIDGYMHVDYTWTASVPKGYDGMVVGFRNREITVDPDQHIDDYYTSTHDFTLFRMK